MDLQALHNHEIFGCKLISAIQNWQKAGKGCEPMAAFEGLLGRTAEPLADYCNDMKRVIDIKVKMEFKVMNNLILGVKNSLCSGHTHTKLHTHKLHVTVCIFLCIRTKFDRLSMCINFDKILYACV